MRIKVNIRPLFTLIVVLCFAPPTFLQADITGGRLIKSSLAKGREVSGSSGLLVVPPVKVEVQRGESVDIPVTVSPFREGLRVKVIEGPLHGSLIRCDDRPGVAAVFRYLHDRSSQDSEDRFSFMIFDPLSEFGGRHTACIIIKNRRAELLVDPIGGMIDFGKTPIGSSATNAVILSNRCGSTIRGTLTLSPPWSIAGDDGIILPEGSSREIKLIFRPRTEGDQSCILRIDPTLEQFPEITLKGSGVAPFEFLGRDPLIMTKEKPEVPLILSNTTATPLMVNVIRLPEKIVASAPLSLVSHGAGTLTISAARMEIPAGSSKKFTMGLSAGIFERNVDLVISGPKADPMLELLHGVEGSFAKVGCPLVVEAVVRNPSDEEHEVEVSLHDLGEKGPVLAKRSGLIRAGGVETFRINWVPTLPGGRILDVVLSDRGRLLNRQSLSVTVVPQSVGTATPKASPAPAPVTEIPRPVGIPDIPKTGGMRFASDSERNMAVVDLKPVLEPGIFWNHLILRWCYHGNTATGFVVETQRHRNSLSDRVSVEEPGLWSPLGNVTPRFEKGFWTVRLAMPWPGVHSYRVYPSGKGEVLLSTLSLKISNGMFYWPMLRALLVTILLVFLVKYIRRRDWGNRMKG
jgi:hypothetical protein